MTAVYSSINTKPNLFIRLKNSNHNSKRNLILLCDISDSKTKQYSTKRPKHSYVY